MKNKCIMFGGYGAINTGDLLLSHIALMDMKKIYGDEISILTPHEGITNYYFPGIPTLYYDPKEPEFIAPSLAIKIKNRIGFKDTKCDKLKYTISHSKDSWDKKLEGCEVLCLTGGGHFTDMCDSLDYYLYPIEVAKKYGCKINFSPNGFGPFKSNESLIKLKRILDGINVKVRDYESLEMLRSIGIEAEFFKDNGFRCQELVNFEKPLSSPDSYKIGLNICSQLGGCDHAEVLRWWSIVIKKLVEHGCDIETFCFHSDPYLDFQEAIQAVRLSGVHIHSINEPILDFKKSLNQIAKYNLIISARFHPIVVANTIGVDTIALINGSYYRAKMNAACDGYDKTSVIFDLHNTSPKLLVNHVLEKMHYGMA